MTEIYLHIVARMADYMDTHLVPRQLGSELLCPSRIRHVFEVCLANGLTFDLVLHTRKLAYGNCTRGRQSQRIGVMRLWVSTRQIPEMETTSPLSHLTAVRERM